MKCECAVMENFSEDGFERCEQFGDWSTCSAEHWDEDHRDSSGFGDWASFKEGFTEESESDSADLLSQEAQTSGYEHKIERSDEPWAVIHDCFHVEEMVRDTDVTDVLPLSQLLHTPPPPAALLINGAGFYYCLLFEPKTLSVTCPKPNLHSQKLLTDTLQLKQSSSNTLQNTDLPHLESEKPEISSDALIQTKLTAPTQCQNSPGFFYQISCQWLNQYSLKLQHHKDKKVLL